MNLKNAGNMLEQVIDTTLKNIEHGITESIVYSLVGDNGLGKTDLPKQIAKARNMSFVQLDIPQMDELTSLTGYPRKIYTIKKKFKDPNDATGKTAIVKEKKVDDDIVMFYLDKGWIPTGQPVLGMANPDFVSELDNPNGSILYLNDYSRGLPWVIQAIMEMLQNRKYAGYTLPDNCIIMASENPSNQKHNVASQDQAQQDRIIKLPVEYDKGSWCEWAEMNYIRSECINFMHSEPEAVMSLDGTSYISPRRWVKLFRMMQNLGSLRSAESLEYIQTHGSRIIGDSIQNFITFLHNGKYELLEPEDMLHNPDETGIVNKLQNSINPNGELRADISALMGIRFKNYMKRYAQELDKSNTPVDAKVIDRLVVLFQNAKLFGADTIMNILESIENNKKFLPLIQKKAVYSRFI